MASHFIMISLKNTVMRDTSRTSINCVSCPENILEGDTILKCKLSQELKTEAEGNKSLSIIG